MNISPQCSPFWGPKMVVGGTQYSIDFNEAYEYLLFLGDGSPWLIDYPYWRGVNQSAHRSGCHQHKEGILHTVPPQHAIWGLMNTLTHSGDPFSVVLYLYIYIYIHISIYLTALVSTPTHSEDGCQSSLSLKCNIKPNPLDGWWIDHLWTSISKVRILEAEKQHFISQLLV